MKLPNELFLTLASAFAWCQNQALALRLLRAKVVQSIAGGAFAGIPRGFTHMSQEQADDLLEKSSLELNLIACFQLIAAAEGWLKHDFALGSQGRSATPLCADFASIYKNRNKQMNNIDVDGGILDVWKKHHASRELSDLIGKFRTFMNFRHWIAHGRFWEPSRLGMAVGKFRPDYVYQETASLLDHLKTLPENFRWQ